MPTTSSLTDPTSVPAAFGAVETRPALTGETPAASGAAGDAPRRPTSSARTAMEGIR